MDIAPTHKKRLDRDFFNRPTLQVAQELLGKALIYKDIAGYITETEAYIGKDDPASHAARGKTPRSAVMFGPPGFTYVYFIYGVYHCLNFVTEPEDQPAAVLIRGLYLPYENLYLNGPGKLCRHLHITRAQNGIDLTSASDLFVTETNIKPLFDSTPRIGISKAKEFPWRYVMRKDSIAKLKPGNPTAKHTKTRRRA
jgi:DNA-3-methyladenine glycosylase